eukprot:TRINITY_DN33980_c0_g1_i1.p1 TRINITY_DN33980_c0_g1~~TRINITY_DN33980_c0_g1_i1.p1  ORF type:complete len:764 (+),score=109.77 TRINITY_DN33980_c0_g1_i1:129-2420(+)
MSVATLILLTSLTARGTWFKVGDGLCCGQSSMQIFDHYEYRSTQFSECKALCEEAQGVGGMCLSISYDFGANICYLDVDDGITLKNMTQPLTTVPYNSVHPAAVCGGGHTYNCYARDMPTLTITPTPTITVSKSTSPSVSLSESIKRKATATGTVTGTNIIPSVTEIPQNTSSPSATNVSDVFTETLSLMNSSDDDVDTATPVVVGVAEATLTETIVIVEKKETIPTDLTTTRQEIAKATAAVAMIAGIASGSVSGTPNLGKMAVLMQLNCDIEGLTEDDGAPLPWELHPLSIAIGTGKERYEVGSIVCNVGLLVGFALLFWIFAGVKYLVLYLLGSKKSFKNNSVELTLAHLRYPGMVYVPGMFLLQGISFSSAKIIFHPTDRSAYSIIIAAVALTATLVIPVLVWHLLLRARSFHAVKYIDPKGTESTLKSRCWKFMFGTHMWVSTRGFFVEKYGVIFEPMKDGMQSWAIFEAYHVVLIGALAAYEAKDTVVCHVRNFTLSFSLLVYFILAMRYSPFSGLPDNLLCKGVSFALLLAVVILTFGILEPTEDADALFITAGWIFIIATFLLLIKMFYDLILYAATFDVNYRSEVGRPLEDSLDPMFHDAEMSCVGSDLVMDVPLSAQPSSTLAGPLRLASPAFGRKNSNDNNAFLGSFSGSVPTLPSPELKKTRSTLSSPKILPPPRRSSILTAASQAAIPLCPSDPALVNNATNSSFLYNSFNACTSAPVPGSPIVGLSGPPAIPQSEALQTAIPVDPLAEL